MPQAVGLFPVAPPPTSRANPSTSSADSGPSKFDEFLDTATKTDASPAQDTNSTPSGASASASDAKDSQQSTDDGSSTDRTSKSGKGKPQKSSAVKSKTSAPSGKKVANDAAADDESATTAADVENVLPKEDDATEAKPKDPQHAAHATDAAPLPQPTDPTTTPPAIQPTRAKDQGTLDPSKDADGKPSKGLAAVKAVAAGQADSADDDDSDDAATAMSAAKPAGDAKTKAVAQVGSAKLGEKISKGGKDANSDSADVSAKADAGKAVDPDVATASDANAISVDGGAGDNSAPSASANPAPHAAAPSFADVLATAQGTSPTAAKSDAPVTHSVAPQAPVTQPEVQFADGNHGQIVSGIQGQLLPNGGTMQLHLSPGELGNMSVSVHMRDGVMTATFETNNDQAAKLLSHSLGQLKTALETQGVNVGRLHVQQAPRNSETGSGSNGNGKNGEPSSGDKSAQQQEQQRKEMIKKMWRRLNGGKDPLDMVA